MAFLLVTWMALTSSPCYIRQLRRSRHPHRQSPGSHGGSATPIQLAQRSMISGRIQLQGMLSSQRSSDLILERKAPWQRRSSLQPRRQREVGQPVPPKTNTGTMTPSCLMYSPDSLLPGPAVRAQWDGGWRSW
jgi:hypothetical protein